MMETKMDKEATDISELEERLAALDTLLRFVDEGRRELAPLGIELACRYLDEAAGCLGGYITNEEVGS